MDCVEPAAAAEGVETLSGVLAPARRILDDAAAGIRDPHDAGGLRDERAVAVLARAQCDAHDNMAADQQHRHAGDDQQKDTDRHAEDIVVVRVRTQPERFGRQMDNPEHNEHEHAGDDEQHQRQRARQRGAGHRRHAIRRLRYSLLDTRIRLLSGRCSDIPRRHFDPSRISFWVKDNIISVPMALMTLPTAPPRGWRAGTRGPVAARHPATPATSSKRALHPGSVTACDGT